MERFLKEFSLQMTADGWDCVFCFDGQISDIFRRYIEHEGVHLERVDGQQNLGFAAAPALLRLLFRYKPQIFVYAFHGVMRCFPWLARISGCKSVYFNDHSSRAPQFVPGPLSRTKRLVGRALTAPLRGIVSVSEFTRRSGESLGLYKAPAIVIPNGVELREFDPVRGQQFRTKRAIPSDAVLITLAAWMVPVKGVDKALMAAKIILESHPETRFLFAGDGTHLNSYHYMVADLGISHAICFAGSVSNPMDEGFFDATDIYIQPSLWQEAAPLAIIEAMSLGVPVVASRVGGIPELVADGVTGYLVPPADAETLAGKVIELISDPARRRAMGERAREAIVSGHQLRQIATRYALAFQEEERLGQSRRSVFTRSQGVPSGLRT